MGLEAKGAQERLSEELQGKESSMSKGKKSREQPGQFRYLGTIY